MPCGPNARLTAYVAYVALAFSEREVLNSALVALYGHVDAAPLTTEESNPVPVLDADRVVVARAALVVRRENLPSRFGDLGFVFSEGAYVPLLPSDGRALEILRTVRRAYASAKANALANQARRRYRGSVQQATAADRTVTIRVRF
jgi:hypothetical protein